MNKEIDNINIFTLDNGETVVFLNVAGYSKNVCGDRGYGYYSPNELVYELIGDRSKIKIKKTDDHKTTIYYGNGHSGCLSDEKIYNLEGNRLLIIHKKAKFVKLDKSQVEAIKKIELCFLENTNPICAYPVGMGKTYIACELIRRFWGSGRKKILLLAKASNLEDPWKKTLGSFEIPFCVIHGPQRKDDYLFGSKYQIGHKVILTSYDTWFGDNDYYNLQSEYDLVVFDELHTIINPKKITKKSLMFSRAKSRHRLAVTATPIQNTDVDIGFMYIFLNSLALLDSLEEGENVVGNKRFLHARDEAMKRNFIILPADSVGKRDVVVKKMMLSLPMPNEMSDYITANGELFSNEHRLFSFLSCPESLYYNNSSEKLNLPCPKADAVDMIIDAMPKEDKVIIFSRHIDVLSAYYERLKKKDYNALIITGQDRGDTGRKLSQFRDNRIFKVLLTTLFKSAEGLNLEVANHVIILEPWWNPQKIMQAMGRVDRRTQKKDCFIYLLCYNENGSVYGPEWKYFEVMEKKIVYAKSFVPIQEELPAVKAFVDKSTFISDFDDFLIEFNATKKTIEDDLKTPCESNNQLMEIRSNDEYMFQEQIKKMIMGQMMNYYLPPSNFDDVDFNME